MTTPVSRNSNQPSPQRYALNPAMYFAAFYLVQITSLPILYIQLAPQIVNLEAYLQTFLISMLFLLCIFAGYYLSPYLGQTFVHRFVSTVSLRFSGTSFSIQERVILSRISLCLFFLSFALHMVVSGGGLLWITNSRQAYATYRIGVGPTYALLLFTLYLSFILTLFTIDLSQPVRHIILSIVKRAIFYSFLAYFLGSKGYILSIAILALLFHNYNVQPIRFTVLVRFGLVIMGVVLGLLFLQGTTASSSDVVSYADYYHNTSEFLRRFDEFGGYRMGAVTLSDLWSYIPRALVPSKPYEYGNIILDQLMFPGAAETGYTPAFLPWAVSYLDFGLPGIIVVGFYAGLFQGWLHSYYLTGPRGVIRFVVLIHSTYISIFPFVPTPGVFLVVIPLFTTAMMSVHTVFGWLRHPSALRQFDQ